MRLSGTRVLLIGTTSVGKTSLISRIIDDSFEPHAIPTTGTAFYQFSTNNPDHPEIQLWDTAGMERYRALNNLFYHQAAGAILVFDVTRRSSFEDIDSWLSEFQAQAASDCPVVLVGNKYDEIESVDVDMEEVHRFAQDRSLRFFLTSALTGEGVELMIESVISILPVRRHEVDTVAIPEPELKKCNC
jgi:small GTP-binding protein